MDTATEAGKLLIRHVPDLRLAGLVTAISAYEERGEKLHDSVEIASLTIPLIFAFRGPFAIALDRRPEAGDDYFSFTAGLHPGHVRIDSRGDAACLQIDFTPVGARLFFGLPMAELTSRMIRLGDFGDPGVSELGDRLADAGGWDDRIRMAQDFVLARIAASAGALKPEAMRAYCEILGKHGDLRIGGLARDLGWSRKRLVAEFREQIGLAPKALARIVRFNRAAELAWSDGHSGWADVAAACGYADQAHLVREFVTFSGAAPRRWRDEIGPREAGTFLQEAASPMA